MPRLHLRSPSPASARRGAVSKGCLVALVVAVVVALLLVVSMAGRYNGLVGAEEGVDARWSAVESAYQRRNDLIPNLVETVKGAADFEASTLTEITEARASVGQVQLGEGAPTDEAQLQQWQEAQNRLGGALSRLLVVAERYPELRATEGFLSLQAQLEGSENRIDVARRDYIEEVQRYNTRVRRFPDNWFAGLFGFERKAQFQADAGASEPPQVDFGDDE